MTYNLKAARFVLGISQQELSLESGVSQSRISTLERGLAEPSENERLRIEEALGVTIWPPRQSTEGASNHG